MQNFDYLPLAVNFLHFNGFLLLAVSVDMAVSSLVPTAGEAAAPWAHLAQVLPLSAIDK